MWNLLKKVLCVLVLACSVEVFAGEYADRCYSFIYFDQGYPTKISRSRRAESMANNVARANPDVVVQTGFYSLRLDCDTMQLSGFDALEGTDYLTALNQPVTQFSPAQLSLRIEKDGKVYTCTSGIVQDKNDQNVCLIESGQYVQRFDHRRLVFTDKFDKQLAGWGRLEVTAWADRVAFLLDMSGVEGIEMTGIQLVSPSGKVHQSGGKGDKATLVVMPHRDLTFQPLEVSDYIKRVTVMKNGEEVECEFDAEENGLKLNLPMDRVRFPEDRDRLDEFMIELHNSDDHDAVLPLIFNEIKSQAITGTSMLLCNEDGSPTGIPVQISKNWHNEKDHRVKHDGPWLRGYAMVPLKAGESRKLRLRVVTGFWGGVPAVSYAHLSVIGYGGNWKWDESALGCWGESMCYDPSQHLGAAFITDVRPSFTLSKNGNKEYNWTENVGGGDFLVYFDANGTYRWTKLLKTAFYWTGPNMTEVHYSGVTDDDAIQFNYRIRSVRTADYHRRFHAYTYKFLKDVDSPQRLVFHQMAADYYHTVDFEKYFVGKGNSLTKELERHAGEGYYTDPIPFAGNWLAAEDTWCNDKESQVPKGNRGLIFMDSTLNGEAFDVYIHPFASSRAKGKNSFDLTANSVNRSYKAGDVVKGELEFVLPAKSVDVYWGDDKEFSGRLQLSSNAWKMVSDEQVNNLQLDVQLTTGKLLNNYPLEIEAAEGKILADVAIKRGGIGHIPVILRNVPAGTALQLERFLNGKWVVLEGVDVNSHTYYQMVYNNRGSIDASFNIQRPTNHLDEEWRIRIVKTK